jgi:uncharacterized protein (TIRG00374 family)
MKIKASLGKIIFFLFLLVFIWILITRFGQTKQIVMVLSSGRWYWILLAVICQIFYYPFYAGFIEFIVNIFGMVFSKKKIMMINIASKFTDVALPLATFGQVAVFVRNAKKEKLPAIDAGIAIVFALLSQVTAFLFLSIIVASILSFFGEQRAYLLIPILFLSLVVTIAVWFLIRLSLFKKKPNKLILWVVKKISKIAGQGDMSLAEIEKIFMETGTDLRKANKKIWKALLLAFMTHLINLLTLSFVYLAFVGTLNPLAVIGGYVACLLFTIVSITPQGVGVAETVMVATFRSFGLDLSQAAVITLAYRSLLYWLPMFVGFYVFSRLELKEENKTV